MAIFVEVITNPLAPSVMNDVALIEVAMGLFGRVEFVTSGRIRLTRTTELAKIARLVVEEAKTQAPGASICSPHWSVY